MSWHWVGPGRGPDPAGPSPVIFAFIPGRAARNAALSAAVAGPVLLRALTMLSSIGLMNCGGRTLSLPKITAVYPPFARAAAAAALAAATSSGDSPCLAGAVRLLKMRGELTIAACSGCANGTLMTSIRKSAEFGSLSRVSLLHPGSSLGERTPAEPEM